MEKIIYKLTDISHLAQHLLDGPSTKVFCFHGQMGSGKTTLIKEMVRQLGGIDVANSPTFGLVNEYHDVKGMLLAYHFDFYRLNSEEEAYDLGLEDYFNSGVWIFIEWPDTIKNLLPNLHREVFLQFIDQNNRKIEF